MKTKTDIPNFLIVGAAKSGTSSLHYYLSRHPDICMPDKIKELNFWHTFNHQEERAILKRHKELPVSIEEYKKHFEHKLPHQICGEASPSYLYYYKDTVENLKLLKENWKDTKIIIILREPIDKIWSHYKFSKNKGLDPENLTLPKALKLESERLKDTSLLPDVYFIDITKYYEQVKYYQENFKNVRVFLFDELKTNTHQLLNEITGFLEIDRFMPDNSNQVFNESKIIYSRVQSIQKIQGLGLGRYVPKRIKDFIVEKSIREEKMSAKTKAYLKKIFKPEVEKLNYIIDKDLSSWLEKYD